jgi:predicted nucleotidyltransferase component of viral defense system
MNKYNEREIAHSEILQLLILYNLYSLKESKDIYFQGGTAIRWCYNGTRFSEDLDFVTHLQIKDVEESLNRISDNIKKGLIAHFGQGEFEVKKRKPSRRTSHISFINFRPLKERRKISVKVEFEELKKGLSPEVTHIVLSMLPQVRYLIDAGEFRIPHPNSIITVESKEEILSDKIRALLERRYFKGRDFYDLWYLASQGVRCTPEIVKKKLQMYKSPFTCRRKVEFFVNPDKKNRQEIIKAIKQDLSRFLPSQEMSLFESNDFREILNALNITFKPLERFKFPQLKEK